LIAPTSSSALCKAPRDLVRLTIPLEAVKNAMSRDGDFRIVALGSSSTQGAGASSPKMCYPAQLEAELNRRFHPDKHFEVVNLGVGGEMADDMLARLDRDVLPLKPDLVVWQTGVNDALVGRPLDDFRMELAQGIDAIRSSGANVIILDLQYYPRSERVEGYKNYLHTMWSVAQEKAVPVLKRHAFMKHLLDSRQFTAAQILAPDLFHLNDLSYRCLGNLVADAIGDGLEQASRPHQRNKTAAVR
jgi:lysophospholipase L1-like esterase